MSSPWIILATRKAYGGTWTQLADAPFETGVAQWLDREGYGYCMTEHTEVNRICKFAWKSTKHQANGTKHYKSLPEKTFKLFTY